MDASKERPRCANLLYILMGLDQKWQTIKPEWMVTTYKYVHNMNTDLNRWRKEITDIETLIADMRNPPETSFDNDKSRHADVTESDKSDDQPDQPDQDQDGTVHERSVVEDIEEKEPASLPW